MKWSQDYFNSEFNEKDPWKFFTSEYEQKKYERQLGLIEQHGGNVKNILEIGCAEGAHTRLISNFFPHAKIIGIDISEKAISRANELVSENISFIHNDILDGINNFEDRFFDVIIWSESIYYIGDRVSAFRLFEFVKTLSQKMSDTGIICLANIINQESGPEERITKRPLMEIYYNIFTKIFLPIHW